MAIKLYSKLTHALRYWLLRKLPPCKQMTRLMSESLERPLSWRERVNLRLHLWICIWCVWYLEQLRSMRDALRLQATKVSDDEISSAISLSAESRERIKRALTQGKG